MKAQDKPTARLKLTDWNGIGPKGRKQVIKWLEKTLKGLRTEDAHKLAKNYKASLYL